MTKTGFSLIISIQYQAGNVYPLGDYKLIQNQTLRTNIISIEWQPVRRIPNEILGVKEITGEY